MITEKDTLIVGVEHGGKTHREVEIRARTTRDLIDVADDPRTLKNPRYNHLSLIARQIVRLGEIPLPITVERLLDIDEGDLDVLMDMEEKVRQRAEEFRAEKRRAQENGVGHGEAGVSAA